MKFSPQCKTLIILIILLNTLAFAQDPNAEIAETKISRIWGGVAADGDKATLDFRAGFFPNDYDLLQHRGQGNENYLGSGFKLACTDWRAPDDSIYSAAVFGPINDFILYGDVRVPITNYLRYKYSEHSVNGVPLDLGDFGTYDPTKFSDGTFDQIIHSTYKNIVGVEISRKFLFWSQSFNDNYLIIEVELTNTGVDHIGVGGDTTVVEDTLHNFYFNMSMGNTNNNFSTGITPQLPEAPNYGYLWQHYYGAREGDSMRVFYFYGADDPQRPGDDMGAPMVAQYGRLLYTNFTFYSILHASQVPYADSIPDVDDFLQPKVTYIGTETKIPNPGSGEDPYGSKNYWAISGGFSAREVNHMPNSFPGTFHMINNDELANPDFSQFQGGTIASVNSKNFCSFGPYEFPPNHKLRFVYAVGIAGIGFEKAKEIGEKWLNGTLEDPPNMPDPNTGWLPSNFAFPTDAIEMDKRKDRWISMGKDSMMLTAWRAKWNFEHGYQIPQAPPPPESFDIRGSGLEDGVFLNWKNPQAENMPNFAGYRILRRLTDRDSVFYDVIYSSGPEDIASEHEFLDTTVLSGAPYYYYLQTKATIDENNINADPSTRGKIMYSSRLLVPNLNSIRPPKHSSEDMTQIRIVPNPYNINDPLVRELGTDGRIINFYNMPPIVSIKIFTENGDLVKTIEHDDAVDESGYEFWDMITDSQQVISSGIYIAVFQKPSGETSFQKFIVVR